jgi:hypothetical protein
LLAGGRMSTPKKCIREIRVSRTSTDGENQMPLVRIDLPASETADYGKSIANVVYDSL